MSLSYSSVFLNPFPFGSGITSAEAFAVGVPVISLPSSISVLQLTLSQTRSFPESYHQLFLASNESDYVIKAVTLATLPAKELIQLKQTIRNESKKNLFHSNSRRKSVLEWNQLLWKLKEGM